MAAPMDQIRRKLDLMNRLHNTGVQLDLDLPQIAVVGNQSAGKSSLIEAISGISLPRKSGTCTRCPIECKLVRTESAWQCIVSLRITTDATGRQLGHARILQFGGIIHDKAHVEERIRRAQCAILSPSKPMERFLNEPDTDLEDPELKFSGNCITLQISGPDIADLSFCDLPGLFASVSSDQGAGDSTIGLVESLVSSYIKKPSCLILLTVACETDFENQGAHRLVKAHDPEGKRTIGVLTKPDRIPAGEEYLWTPFIRDEKERLENNWFCVKQPSSLDIKANITWEQARQAEEEYFSFTPPWCDLQESYRKYLGTDNLVNRLTNLLSDLIAARLPQIQAELRQSITQIRETLAKLPPPPSSDPRTEVLTLLHAFTQDVVLYVQGIPDSTSSSTERGLIQSIHPEQQKFKRAVRSTAPEFWPFEASATVAQFHPPTFLREEEEYYSLKKGDKNLIPIDDVLLSMQMARTRELPGHYPFVVQKMFIENITKQWEEPSEELCKDVYHMVSKHVKRIVTKHLHSLGQGKLEQRVGAIVQQHIDECYSRARERVRWLRRLESSPFTLNTHYLADYKEKFLAYYKGQREQQVRLQTMVGETSPRTQGIFKFSLATPSTQTATVQSPMFEANKPNVSQSVASNPSTASTQASIWAPIYSARTTPVTFGGQSNGVSLGAGQLSPASQTTFSSGPSSSGGAFLSSSSNPLTLPTSSSSIFTPSPASNASNSTAKASTPQSIQASPTVTPKSIFTLPAPKTAAAPAAPSISLSTVQGPVPQESAHSVALTKVLSGLADLGFNGVTEADLPKLLPSDRMESALVVMADVRAYFQVAYKRFADNVPLAIDAELVLGVPEGLLKVLFAQLGINGPNGEAICKDLLQENRKTAERRSELQTKLERLEAGVLELVTEFV